MSDNPFLNPIGPHGSTLDPSLPSSPTTFGQKFLPNPSNANPYPQQQISQQALNPISSSAPASAESTGSGGTNSIPRLDSIPEPQAMQALLKLKGM